VRWGSTVVTEEVKQGDYQCHCLSSTVTQGSGESEKTKKFQVDYIVVNRSVIAQRYRKANTSCDACVRGKNASCAQAAVEHFAELTVGCFL